MQTATTDTNSVYRKIAWRLVPLLVLGYIVAYLDRSNIGFAKLQMSHDLGFSDAVYGLGAGLFYLGYSVFEIPSNLVLRRIGARLTFARIMIIWGLVSGAFALIETPLQFHALRFLLGCAEAGFFPGVLLYMTYWIPATRRARFTAFFMSAMALSGLFGGPLSGWVMSSMQGFGGWRGWQWMFIVEAAPAVVLGVITLFYLVDRPEQARWLTDAEKDVVKRDLDKEESKQRQASTGTSILDAFRDRRLYALGAMAIALLAGIGGISFWLPSILRASGIKEIWQIGLLSAIPYLAALVSQQWVAYRSDRRQERRWHAGVCAAIGGLSWLLMPSFSDQPGAALVLLTLVAAGSFGATGPFWSMPGALLTGKAAAAGIALVTTFGGIGGFIIPIIVGWATTKTGTLAAGQYFYGAVMLVAAGLLVWGTRAREAPVPTQPATEVP
jgi:D-galactonate transporter